MKRILALALTSGALMLLSTAFTTTQAMAATTVPVSMTFSEPGVPFVNSGCPQGSSCGHGQVIPFGQATETIVFGACGTEPECNVRTINLAGGMIFIHEFFSNPTCPGACQPNPALPGGGTLTDQIVGGTGNFANATGNLSGSVTLAGGVIKPAGVAVVKLSGAITLAS
jgi:hypothetical protein